MMRHAETLQTFAQRSASPDNQQHRDTAALVEQSGGENALGEMHDRLMELLATRPSVHRIEVVRGDVEATLRLIEIARRDSVLRETSRERRMPTMGAVTPGPARTEHATLPVRKSRGTTAVHPARPPP